MSLPTSQELNKLKEVSEYDDEKYHLVFDSILESKLKELDPEWIDAMQKVYQNSGMCRWYA